MAVLVLLAHSSTGGTDSAAEESDPSTASALSYGMVTSQVQKGETTQLDLIELFGSPNISTYDSAGIETWVYERSVTQTDIQTESESAQGAANLSLFFSVAQGGAGASAQRSGGQSKVSASLRSITVIIKFAADGTVSDYKVRSSQF